MLILSVLAFIGVLMLALVFRGRAPGLLAPIGITAFAMLASVALSAVAMPAAYERLAARALEATGVRARIVALDEGLVLNDLADVSDELVAAGRALSRDGASLLDLAAEVLRGLQASGQRPKEDAPLEGADRDVDNRILYDNLYPGLVAVTGVILRGMALVASLSGLVATSAMLLAAAAGRELRDLRASNAGVLQRIEALEAGLAGAARNGKLPGPRAPGARPSTD